MFESILLGVIGPNQILIIAVVIVLLFGARKIPQLMKGIGQGIKEFKDAKDGLDKDKKDDEKSLESKVD
jgi:sec-independent protein translocase protein TatA